MGYADKSLAPGETILYRARYHWIFYRTGIVIFALAVLLGVAAFYASRNPDGRAVAGIVGWAALTFAALAWLVLLARWIRARQDEFVVTDRRVLRAVGLFTREHEQAPIDKIQDITVTQTALGRVLGYGDVVLETASERGSLLFPAIARPEAFRTAIWGRPRTGESAAAVALPGAPAPPTSVRLEELEALKRRGMVSEAEYAAKRREILSRL